MSQYHSSRNGGTMLKIIHSSDTSSVVLGCTQIWLAAVNHQWCDRPGEEDDCMGGQPK